jgi:hypothetical protein
MAKPITDKPRPDHDLPGHDHVEHHQPGRPHPDHDLPGYGGRPDHPTPTSQAAGYVPLAYPSALALQASRFQPHPHPDGAANAMAYLKENGKFLSIGPDGKDAGDRDSAQTWEKFIYVKGNNFCEADRDGDNVYILPVAPSR